MAGMGVDTRITINPGARVHDVATVMAIATGANWTRHHLGPSCPGAWLPKVPSLKIEGIPDLPECCHIRFESPLCPNSDCYVLYHFEWSDGDPGATGLLPRSTPFWLAVGSRLIDFFGGSIDYNDSDDVDVDDVRPTRYRCASDGQAWQDFQSAMTRVERIDLDTILTFSDVAAYTP